MAHPAIEEFSGIFGQERLGGLDHSLYPALGRGDFRGEAQYCFTLEKFIPGYKLTFNYMDYEPTIMGIPVRDPDDKRFSFEISVDKKLKLGVAARKIGSWNKANHDYRLVYTPDDAYSDGKKSRRLKELEKQVRRDRYGRFIFGMNCTAYWDAINAARNYENELMRCRTLGGDWDELHLEAKKGRAWEKWCRINKYGGMPSLRMIRSRKYIREVEKWSSAKKTKWKAVPGRCQLQLSAGGAELFAYVDGKSLVAGHALPLTERNYENTLRKMEPLLGLFDSI